MLAQLVIFNDIEDDESSSSSWSEVSLIEIKHGLTIPVDSIKVKEGIYVNSEFVLATGLSNLDFVRSILLNLPLSEKFIPDHNCSDFKVYFNADFRYKSYVKLAVPEIYSIELFHIKTGKQKRFNLGSHIPRDAYDLVKRSMAPFFLIRYETIFRKKLEDMKKLGIKENYA